MIVKKLYDDSLNMKKEKWIDEFKKIVNLNLTYVKSLIISSIDSLQKKNYKRKKKKR